MTGELKAYVVTGPTDEPVGTMWAEDWFTAQTRAIDLYGALAFVQDADSAPQDWLQAMHREWLATHRENETLDRERKRRARIDRVMRFLETFRRD